MATPVMVPHSDSWTIESAHTGGRYRVSLSTPIFPVDGPVPLVVVLDGDTMFLTATEFARTVSLVTLGALPQIAVVGVMRDEADPLTYMSTRFHDFTPVEWHISGPFEADNAMATFGTGGADGLLATIAEQVLPAVHERVAVDRSRVAVCGWSLSGLFAAHAWRTRPDVFPHLLAISPSFWWCDAWSLDQPLPTRSAADRAFVCAGEHEEGDISQVWPQVFANEAQREMAAMVRHVRRFGELAAASGATSETVVFDDEHHCTVQAAALARGLRFLYG